MVLAAPGDCDTLPGTPMKILVSPGRRLSGRKLPEPPSRVLRAADRPLYPSAWSFETQEIGLGRPGHYGTTLPPEGADTRIPEVERAVILGPVLTLRIPISRARRKSILPAKLRRQVVEALCKHPPVAARARPSAFCGKPMDLVIVREKIRKASIRIANMYAGSGRVSCRMRNSAFSIRKITAAGLCQGIRRAPLSPASPRGEGDAKWTAVHKANVVKLSDGLFLREVRQGSPRNFPDVELERADRRTRPPALLIRTPERFDVIVTTNMFGDILSDEASELVREASGLGGSINAGDAGCVGPGAGTARLPEHRRPENIANPHVP